MGFDKITYIVVAIFVLAICSVIYTAMKNFRLSWLGKCISREPSDELVFKYYKALKHTTIINEPREWNSLRNTFFIIKNSRNVSEDNKESLYKLLLFKGCNMPMMTFKTSEKVNEIEKKIKKSGEDGERKVNYMLRWLPKEYKIMSNVKLNSSLESQEFDNIVVGPNGIFHIETKNFGGSEGCKIKITEDGSWIKIINNVESGIESPEFQIMRHSRVIKENLDRNYGVDKYKAYPLIVLSNPKTILEGAANCKTPVMKAEKTVDYISNYKSEYTLSTEEINDVYNKINLCKIN